MTTTNANNILNQKCQKNWFDVFVRYDRQSKKKAEIQQK